jgi:hypothetical protein
LNFDRADPGQIPAFQMSTLVKSIVHLSGTTSHPLDGTIDKLAHDTLPFFTFLFLPNIFDLIRRGVSLAAGSRYAAPGSHL